MQENLVFTDGTTIKGDGSNVHPLKTVAGAPGGANTDVQFNNAGVLGGSADFTFDPAAKLLQVGGSTHLSSFFVFIDQAAGDLVLSTGTSTQPANSILIGTPGGFLGDNINIQAGLTANSEFLITANNIGQINTGNTLSLSSASLVLGALGKSVGFFGSIGTAKPVVAGSKASGAALVSLLAALVGLGLITDNTTP